MACGLQPVQIKLVVLRAIRKNTGITVVASDSIWFKLHLGSTARQFIYFWVRAELLSVSPDCVLPAIDLTGAQIVSDVQDAVIEALS